MATDKNILKNWFKTGLKPTQSQFWAWMDSYWHKDEKIDQSAISGLESTLNAKAEKDQFEAHKTDQEAHSDLFLTKEDKSKKGVPNGYASLDAWGKVPASELTDNQAKWGNITGTISDQADLNDALLAKLTATIATDAETQITAPVVEDNKVVSRAKLRDWWNWQKTQAQIFYNTIQGGQFIANSFVKNGGTSNEILLADGNTSSLNAKLTATIATDAETQITNAVGEDNKVVSRLKLFNWWIWQKTLAQVFGSSVQAHSFNTGTYININQYYIDLIANASKRISFDSLNARIAGQNGVSTTLIYFNTTPTANNIYIPNASGNILLDSTLKSLTITDFQKGTYTPLYIRINNFTSDVQEDLRINVSSGNNRPFFERCIVGASGKGAGTWERTVTTVKLNNSGIIQGAVAINTIVDIPLSSAAFTWDVDSLASRTGALASALISGGKVLDVDDKTTNTFRVTMEFTYSAGSADGTIEMSLINPSGVIIDQESENINIDGQGGTSKISVFRFFVVKTSDNNVGYTLRMTVGSKALTGWRVKSILRTNN